MDDLFKKAGDLYPLKTTGRTGTTCLPGSGKRTLAMKVLFRVTFQLQSVSDAGGCFCFYSFRSGFGSVVYFSHSEKHAGENALPILKKNGNPDQAVRANPQPAGTDEQGLPNKLDKPSGNQAGNLTLSEKKTSSVGFTPAGFGNSRSWFQSQRKTCK